MNNNVTGNSPDNPIILNGADPQATPHTGGVTIDLPSTSNQQLPIDGGEPTSPRRSSRHLSHNELEMARQYSEASARVSFARERKARGKKADVGVDDLKKEVEMWEHKVTPLELADRLGTDLDKGLSASKAKEILDRDGPNVLTPPKVKPWWLKLLGQFTNFFAILLQVAAILCFVGYALDSSSQDNLYLGVVLLAVVVLTAIFTFFQEFKSEKTMEKFKSFLPPQSVVVRGGETMELDAKDLVVGDLIEVKLGDKIPADIRIVRNQKLKVDNSSLTGESEPLGRTVESTDDNPLETKNLAFFGTLAVDGTATGVVVNTGDRTVFGRIAGLAASSGSEITTLQREIHHFIIFISVVAVTLGIIFFVFGFIKGTDPISNIVFAIGIIVANVPEGLLATVTVSLTLTAKRMAKKNVLVKKLEAVETLGSTTTICSDKTGTLTQNRMTIVHIMYDNNIYMTETATQQKSFDENDPTYKSLFYLACNCAKAVFDAKDLEQNPDKPIDERKVNGDASEAGILKFAQKQEDVMQVRASSQQVSTIPFNSANKFMVTINKVPDESGVPQFLRVCMKGAPERILDRCDRIMKNGQVSPLTGQDRAAIDENLQQLMDGGERVLGFAQYDLPVDEYPFDYQFETETDINFPMEKLTFVGLMALLDPPRESVPHAVKTCQQAGVQVIMVTGDHPATAKSIAKQVGIIDGKTADDIAKERGIAPKDVDPEDAKAIVVPGSQIRDLDESDWDRVLAYDEIVFARTSPQQKLIIVENCQRLGKVVAVTGDGVNDSPALKKANIGIAMGIAGSDVSKEAADMILLDDNFSSIVNGVQEGRLIFDNLKKSIAYTLSSNIPEIVPFLLFIILSMPLMLTTILILTIDLGTDMVPAISLAYEEAESDIMLRKPRNSASDRLVNRRLISFAYFQIGVIQAMGGIFTFLTVMNDYGLQPQVFPFLQSKQYFAPIKEEKERWMYSEHTRSRSPAFDADFWDIENDDVARFFDNSNIPDGFIEAGSSRFRNLLPQGDDEVRFENMVKAIGVETGRVPCLRYSCDIGGEREVNDPGCFNTDTTNGVRLDGLLSDGEENDEVNEGSGEGEGCFKLWTVKQQDQTLRHGQTAYLVTIIVVQIGDILVTKTRLLSLFQQGLRNWVLNLGILSELSLGALIVYAPFLNSAFQTAQLRFVHWLPGLPFLVFIFVYDETRKFLMRRGDRTGMKFGKWLKTNTYW